MSYFYRQWVRPVLFAQNAEQAHDSALDLLASVSRDELLCKVLGKFFHAPELPIDLFGLRFPNPVGLAAGMDKFAAAVPAWEKLGFGFSELGGVTRYPQPGNPQPRMFRAMADEAIVNRMGFNNAGADIVAERLAEWRNTGRWPNHPVGINLGKSKITPLGKAAEDYAYSFRRLRGLADFFVVNVSSPNTPGLRQLQDKKALDEILAAVQELNVAARRQTAANLSGEISAALCRDAATPILVKVAPDLSFEALDEILELAASRNISGIVATNTTITRPQTDSVKLKKIYAETGGLSGKPLRVRSTEIISHIFKQTQGRLPIIGVGGIFNADDAWDKFIAGASLVQVYTGLVYEGPGIAKKIVRDLIDKMERAGAHNLKDLVTG